MLRLTTERLCLRRFTPDDAAFIFKLLNSPGWLANIGDRNIRSVQDAQKYISEKYLPLYDESGVGAYVIELKESAQVVGTCGLYKRPNLEHPDIGFALLPGYEKNGYAFEAASALMNYVSTELNCNIIYGITIPQNQPSIQLLERLGLLQKGTIRLEGDKEDLLLFSNE